MEKPTNILEVSKEEFFKHIGPQDAIFESKGKLPATTTDFLLRQTRQLLGTIVKKQISICGTEDHYYLIKQ